jgi:hypothetical protein
MHARDLVIDRDGHVVLHRLPFSAKVPPKLEDLPYARIPPEVLVGMIGYSQESEWYSFGILLLELALGKVFVRCHKMGVNALELTYLLLIHLRILSRDHRLTKPTRTF